MVEQELTLTRHIYQLCGLSVAGAGPLKLSEPFPRLSLSDLLRTLFFVAGQQRGLSSATSRHLVAAGESKNFHSILTEAYSVFDNWPVNYFRFLDQRRAQEKKVTRAYQRMKSALYGEFGSFYSGLHNILPGNQFDFMRIALMDYVIQNRIHSSFPNSKLSEAIADFPSGQYVLKSDARRLLGTSYGWVNNCIRQGKIRCISRSKGMKRLIFVDVADIAKLMHEDSRQ
jgi:hypothetical protein